LAHAGVANSCILFAATDACWNQALTAMIIDSDVEGLTVTERACAVGAVPMARLAVKGWRGAVAGRLGAYRSPSCLAESIKGTRSCAHVNARWSRRTTRPSSGWPNARSTDMPVG